MIKVVKLEFGSRILIISLSNGIYVKIIGSEG